jgi:hypothetical protein
VVHQLQEQVAVEQVEMLQDQHLEQVELVAEVQEHPQQVVQLVEQLEQQILAEAVVELLVEIHLLEVVELAVQV